MVNKDIWTYIQAFESDAHHKIRTPVDQNRYGHSRWSWTLGE